MSLETVQIEVFRGSIGGETHGHFVLAKGLKQAFENHGVGNVEHLKFVDVEKGRVLSKLIAYDRNGLSLLPSQLLVNLVLHLVNLEHEFVVVLPLLSIL